MKLNDDTKFIILMLAIIAAMAVQCYHPIPVHERAKIFYDCRASESSDTPPKIRDECRKLREK